MLRLARTLAMDDYLAQRPDGTWRLARAAGWLGACYQATFNIVEVVQPILRELSAATGESATFYVREGKQRICMARVEGPKSIRHHVRVGAALPLELGSPGRVLLAFSGEPGEPYESVRRAGYMVSLGSAIPRSPASPRRSMASTGRCKELSVFRGRFRAWAKACCMS